MNERECVSLNIKQELVQRAKKFFIEIDDVSITHLTFSDEFLASVEAKQVALQNAERAKYIVEKAIQDKKNIIVKAQGEAISIKLIGEYINLPYQELKRLGNAVRIAEALSESKNRILIDTNTLMMDISKLLSGQLMYFGKKINHK